MNQLALRGLKFYSVGALGIAVQLATLALLKGAFELPYLVATALAVEVAVVHNFLWHDRWTWSDRPGGWDAFVRFNLTTGAISILSNVALMRLLVGVFQMHYMPANLVAVGLAAVANFLASEMFAFRASPQPSRRPTPAIRGWRIRIS